MHIPKRPHTLALALLACATLILTSSCTEEEANATAAPKQGNLPTVIVEMPGEPQVVAYLRSPAQLATKWIERVAKDLPDGDPVRAHLQRTLMGPIEGGIGSLAGLEGTTTIGVYPRGDGREPAILIRVKGGRELAMNQWVEHAMPVPPTGVASVEGTTMRKAAFAGETWLYGELRGDWYFSNDEKLLAPKKSRKRNMLMPVLEECWQLAVESGKPDVFIAGELPRVPAKSEIGRALKGLGLDRADFVVYVLEDHKNRFVDSLFLHSPAPHKGLLALADGDTIAPEIIKDIAEEALSFGYMPMDLGRLWADVQGVIPPQFGMMVTQFEERMQLSLQKDLLASLGTGWVWNRFPHSTSQNGVATVARIPVEDDRKLQLCLDKLANSMSMPLEWQDGPKGYRLLNLPMGGAIAARKDHWFVGPSEAALRVWLSDVVHRGGHTAPKDLFQRFSKRATWLAWVSEAALRADTSTEIDVESMLTMQGVDSSVLANLPMNEWQERAPQMFGDMIMAVIPGPKGLTAMVESDCGVFPWLLVSGLTAADYQREEKEREQLRGLRDQIAQAQQLFHDNEGRFAGSLWELGDAGLVDAETASGIKDGHLFRIVANKERWSLEFKRESDNSVFMVRQ